MRASRPSVLTLVLGLLLGMALALALPLQGMTGGPAAHDAVMGHHRHAAPALTSPAAPMTAHDAACQLHCLAWVPLAVPAPPLRPLSPVRRQAIAAALPLPKGEAPPPAGRPPQPGLSV